MRALLTAALAAACVSTAHARITEINVQRVEPFANSASFGDVGAYERVRGVAKGELDPADPRNKGIVNLDRVPRNARGRVEYEVEWFMLRPANPALAAPATVTPKPLRYRGGEQILAAENARWSLGQVQTSDHRRAQPIGAGSPLADIDRGLPGRFPDHQHPSESRALFLRP